ncbi:uncharacterized protein E0L32_007441 [Thyridium curvatum]|uniref:Uncharacterized protein n=1 Tax=Thyridium curvatum TaxID=1093900 RepID=A0A507AW49_9PEZI|nr:uncharacterized protein E0L32_007441 [Thyridium curvatum]TPX11943.1 hypothetical protein E0L32_007441 [Thyridium curvatum]
MPQHRYNLRPGAKGRQKASPTPEPEPEGSAGSRSSPEAQAPKKGKKVAKARRKKKVQARKRAQSTPSADGAGSPQGEQEEDAAQEVVEPQLPEPEPESSPEVQAPKKAKKVAKARRKKKVRARKRAQSTPSADGAGSPQEQEGAAQEAVEPQPAAQEEQADAVQEPVEPQPAAQEEQADAVQEPVEPQPAAQEEEANAAQEPVEPQPAAQEEQADAVQEPVEPQPAAQEEEADAGVVDRQVSPASPEGSYSPPSAAIRLMERYQNPPEGLDDAGGGAAGVESPGNDHPGMNEQDGSPGHQENLGGPANQAQEIAGDLVSPVPDGLPRGDLDAQWDALDQAMIRDAVQNQQDHMVPAGPARSPGRPPTAEDHAAHGIQPEGENPYSPELAALLGIDLQNKQLLVAEAVAYHAARERQAREAPDPRRAERDGWQSWWPQHDPLVREWVGDRWNEMSRQEKDELLQDLASSDAPEARRRQMAADIQEAEALRRRQWNEQMEKQLLEREDNVEIADDGQPQVRLSLENFTAAVAWEVAEQTRVYPAWATPDEVYRVDDASS